MEQKTRTEYSVMNASVAMIAQFLAIFMGFITRVVFTRTLSEGYVGINGLFTDILNILSLSELGVGTAITYALYEPIAKKDIKRQQILMRMFKNFYRGTAAFVLTAGLMLIPFLDVLMKNRPDVDHLILIYVLYLLNSVVSYLLIYKKTMVDAHQLNYLTVINHNGFLVLQDICQIIILLVTKNFVIFLLAAVLCTFCANVTMSKKADELFPYLKEPCKERLPEDEHRDIVKNVKAMLMHKLGTVVVSNTDNLLISSFVGVITAGIYSNYFLIIGSVRQVLEQVFQSIAASIGNLGVMEKSDKVHKVFLQLFFIGQWMYGVAAICLFEMLNPFVEFAFGKKYLFEWQIVLVLCISFLLNGMRRAVTVFKESMGFFWNDRYKAVAEAILNLVISVALVIKLGVAGVFIGTIASILLTTTWVEPYVMYKHCFKQPVGWFFMKYIYHILIIVFVWICTNYCCSLYRGNAFLNLLYRGVICAFLPNLLFILIYRRTEEWKELWKLVEKIGKKVFRMIRKCQ